MQIDFQVVLQVRAHAGQIVHQRDIEFAQQGGCANPRALQYLRRGDRARAQQDFLVGMRRLRLVMHQISDTDRALAGKQNPIRQRMGHDGQVGTLARLVQITARSAGTPPLLCGGPIHRTKAFLLEAVQILGARVTGLDTGIDHGLEQRIVARLGRRHAEWAGGTVVVVAANVACLGFLEVRQAVEVRPAFQPLARSPAVVIQRIAADVAHAIDQG